METFIRSYNLKNINLCDEFIEYHKNNKEYKGEGYTYHGVDKKIKNSIDVSFFNGSRKLFIQEYFIEISEFLTDYMNYFNIGGFLQTEQGTNIQYYPPKEGGFFKYHCERGSTEDMSRQVVFMTYLNDIEEGGETEFLFQKVKVKPKKGLTLLWPSDFTHKHRGLPCNFEKWIVTGWFCHRVFKKND